MTEPKKKRSRFIRFLISWGKASLVWIVLGFAIYIAYDSTGNKDILKLDVVAAIISFVALSYFYLTSGKAISGKNVKDDEKLTLQDE